MARNSVPISPLPSGRWRLRGRRDDSGHQPSWTFDTRAEGVAFWHAMETDKARGAWIHPKDAATTFGDYAREWLAGRVTAPSTTERIAGNLRCHILPVIGDVPLSKLRPTQLQNMVAGWRAKGLQPSTIGVVAQHLQQVLNGAVIDRLVPSNPAANLTLPRVDTPEVVIPTETEMAEVMSSIAPRFRALVAVGAGLGLRQGEAFGLSVDRIDFLRRTVKIDRQLVRPDSGPPRLGPPKTSNSYRTIPLPERIGEILAQHIERYPIDDPDGLLFTAAQGGRLRRDSWNRRTWKPAVAAAGQPDYTFHVTRHFYASALIRSGQSIVVVANRLGDSVQTVTGTYAHLWHDDDERTRDAIDQLWGGAVAL